MLRQSFLLCILIAATCSDATSCNDLIDPLLEALLPSIQGEGKDLALDDIDYLWSYKLLFFFTGHESLSCSSGRVHHMTSIKRIGNARCYIADLGTVVEATATLEVVDFRFDDCKLAIKHFLSLNESVEGTVKSNSLTVKANFNGNNTRIDSLRLDELSGIEVTTGTSFLHRLENYVFNQVVQKFNDSIVNSINHTLKQLEGNRYEKYCGLKLIK